MVILRETESQPWGPARLRGRMGQPHAAPQPESTLVFIGHVSGTVCGPLPGAFSTGLPSSESQGPASCMVKARTGSPSQQDRKHQDEGTQ